MAREAALHSFDKSAAALAEDWNTAWDGKQIQRWGEGIGQRVALQRDAEVDALARGSFPDSPPDGPDLLVIGMDGGRVQMREADPETGSRWREDKVATFTTYLAGDGDQRPPRPLVTTHVGTMRKAESFGKLVRVEALRRGMNRARIVLVMGDGGTWIDPLTRRECLCDQRIVDFHHAVEHLYEAARAAHRAPAAATALAEQMKGWLVEGAFDSVLTALRREAERVGVAAAEDDREHPRRVLWNALAYFELHRGHMQYAEYRRRGWPIGSGVTESGVKQFNQRVKGSDRFWREWGAEAILALRGLWLSQDDRWARYWSSRPAHQAA